MSKITDVIIIDEKTLRLNVDAKKGDEIDLVSLNQIDTSILRDQIDRGKNAEYQKLLADVKAKLELEKQNEILVKEQDVKKQFEEKITELSNKLTSLQATYTALEQSVSEKAALQASEEIKKYQDKIHELEMAKQLTEEKKKTEVLELRNQIVLQNSKLVDKDKECVEKIKIALLEKENEVQKLLNEKDNEIIRLKNDRTTLNVKRIGEDLERWCNNEYGLYAQSGFLNCTWEKDNESIKEEDETKGTKADFIFRVYASEDHKDELTSVACEMKSEDPNSVNRKTNESHYKKLDKDRIKKKCEYALLVSELELDKYDIPIKKVQEYEKMYVVRPQYFITFLSIVESLGRKYQKLLLDTKKESLKFEETEKILENFNKMKEDLLTKTIDKITKQVMDINKKASDISKNAESIISLSNDIIETQLNKLRTKIQDFNITKITKSIDKIEE